MFVVCAADPSDWSLFFMLVRQQVKNQVKNDIEVILHRFSTGCLYVYLYCVRGCFVSHFIERIVLYIVWINVHETVELLVMPQSIDIIILDGIQRWVESV